MGQKSVGVSIGEEASEREHAALARVVSVELGARAGERGSEGSWQMSHRWSAFLDMGSGQLGDPSSHAWNRSADSGPGKVSSPKGSIPPKCLSLPVPSPSPRLCFTFKEALE